MIELTFDIYSLLISIALVIALTFGFLLLFTRRENKRADRYLASLMFIVALWNASILILSLNLYRYAAGVIWIPLTYTLALGPCFYFYIRLVTDFEHHQKIKIWPHFIPVVIEVVLYLIQVFQGLPLGVGYFQTQLFMDIDPIVGFLAILSLMIYGYFGRKRIQAYHHWVKEHYSHYHRYNLNWLLRLSSVFLFFLTLWLGYFLMDYFLFDYSLSISEYYPFYLTLAIISIWLSVEAFIQPGSVYLDQKITLKSEANTSPVSNKELAEKAHWLKTQIEINLLFLDPELSLKSMADTLDIHPNLVSKIINEGMGQTFSDCINNYRIEAVIKKMKDRRHDKTTFLAIAFDCGFNSKTTFNRVFKKQMGQTPQQYRATLTKHN
jgi:AraC-like DNA-binding protein